MSVLDSSDCCIQLSAEAVVSFFESWGLTCGDGSSIRSGLLSDMLMSAENLAGLNFAHFVDVVTNSSNGETYLMPNKESDLMKSWIEYTKYQEPTPYISYTKYKAKKPRFSFVKLTQLHSFARVLIMKKRYSSNTKVLLSQKKELDQALSEALKKSLELRRKQIHVDRFMSKVDMILLECVRKNKPLNDLFISGYYLSFPDIAEMVTRALRDKGASYVSGVTVRSGYKRLDKNGKEKFVDDSWFLKFSF